MAAEKSTPLRKALTIDSADRNFDRGMPCWSTMTMRMLRRSSSRIRLTIRSAACCCSAVCRPCSATKPFRPMPDWLLTLIRTSFCGRGGGADAEWTWLARGEPNERGHDVLMLALGDGEQVSVR